MYNSKPPKVRVNRKIQKFFENTTSKVCYDDSSFPPVQNAAVRDYEDSSRIGNYVWHSPEAEKKRKHHRNKKIVHTVHYFEPNSGAETPNLEVIRRNGATKVYVPVQRRRLHKRNENKLDFTERWLNETKQKVKNNNKMYLMEDEEESISDSSSNTALKNDNTAQLNAHSKKLHYDIAVQTMPTVEIKQAEVQVSPASPPSAKKCAEVQVRGNFSCCTQDTQTDHRRKSVEKETSTHDDLEESCQAKCTANLTRLEHAASQTNMSDGQSDVIYKKISENKKANYSNENDYHVLNGFQPHPIQISNLRVAKPQIAQDFELFNNEYAFKTKNNDMHNYVDGSGASQIYDTAFRAFNKSLAPEGVRKLEARKYGHPANSGGYVTENGAATYDSNLYAERLKKPSKHNSSSIRNNHKHNVNRRSTGVDKNVTINMDGYDVFYEDSNYNIEKPILEKYMKEQFQHNNGPIKIQRYANSANLGGNKVPQNIRIYAKPYQSSQVIYDSRVKHDKEARHRKQIINDEMDRGKFTTALPSEEFMLQGNNKAYYNNQSALHFSNKINNGAYQHSEPRPPLNPTRPIMRGDYNVKLPFLNQNIMGRNEIYVPKERNILFNETAIDVDELEHQFSNFPELIVPQLEPLNYSSSPFENSYNENILLKDYMIANGKRQYESTPQVKVAYRNSQNETNSFNTPNVLHVINRMPDVPNTRAHDYFSNGLDRCDTNSVYESNNAYAMNTNSPIVGNSRFVDVSNQMNTSEPLSETSQFRHSELHAKVMFSRNSRLNSGDYIQRLPPQPLITNSPMFNKKDFTPTENGAAFLVNSNSPESTKMDADNLELNNEDLNIMKRIKSVPELRNLKGANDGQRAKNPVNKEKDLFYYVNDDNEIINEGVADSHTNVQQQKSISKSRSVESNLNDPVFCSSVLILAKKILEDSKGSEIKYASSLFSEPAKKDDSESTQCTAQLRGLNIVDEIAEMYKDLFNKDKLL